jgi:polar amino acid transport system substrate-binding protein
MKKILIAALAASLLLGACQKQEDEGQKEKVYTVGTEYNWPPLEFIDENKQKVGFDVDMIQAIAKAVGIKVELQEVPFDPIFTKLDDGSLDIGLSSITITEERKATLDFTEPYLNAGQMLVVPVASSAAGIDDLKGKKIAVQTGTTGQFALDKLDGYVKEGYDDIANAFADLANGRVDAVLTDSPVAADYVTRAMGFKGKLKLIGSPLTDEYLGIAVKKGNKELLDLLNKGLAAIVADGTLDSLKVKWELK